MNKRKKGEIYMYNNNYGYNYNYNNNNDYNEYQMTAVRKGKKAPLIAGITAALLLGGCGAAYAAVPAVNNAVNKTVMSPEKYCRNVYSKAFDDAASRMNDCFAEAGSLYSTAISFEFSDELKKKVNESLESEICGKITFECETGCTKEKDAVAEYKGVLKADGEKAAEADLIYDSKNGVLYLTIPEFCSKTLKIELPEDNPASFKIPSVNSKDYSKLINEYAKILAEYSANDSTKKNTNVFGLAAGVSYSYTELVTVIDGNQVKALMKDTADFMEKSELIKDIYNDYSLPYQAFSEDMTFDKVVDDIRNTDTSDFESVTLYTYVDPNGDIRGITVEQNSEKLFSFAEAKEDNNIGIEFDFDKDKSVTVNAVQNKKTYSGTVKVIEDYEEMYSFDFKDLQIDKKSIEGSFGCDIKNPFDEKGEEEHMDVYVFVNDKSQKYEIYIDSIGCLTISSEQSKQKADIKIPENAEKVDDFSNISDFFDKEDAANTVLEKFGLSEDDLFAAGGYAYGGFDSDYSMDDDADDSWFTDDDNDDMAFSFSWNDEDQDWNISDGELEGSWQINDDGSFEWVPAA